MIRLLLCLPLVFAVGSTTWGQSSIDRGDGASAFLRNFRQSASSDNLRQTTVARDRTAIGGLGVPTVEAPSSVGSATRPPRRAGTSPIARTPSSPTTSGLSAPPRSRSASFGIGGGSGAKPFSNVSASPTVSPYLGLFTEDLNGFDDLNYQTNVRPRLQQRAFNEQIARQAQAINRRLTSISARNAFNTTGAQNIAPTGHTATFQNYSRFYPAKSGQRQAGGRR